MEEIYRELLDAIRSGEPVALVTIVETIGSTPREVGAKMLVRADGSSVGTIGGGAGEAQAMADALDALHEGESRLVKYSFRGKDADDFGICGGEMRVFIEVVGVKPTLLIAGAGHVGQPLAQIGALLGFRTIVADDRPEFASPKRFPFAAELIVAPLERLGEKVRVTNHTYVVIATRGHEQDEIVLRQMIRTPAAYIGLIGSRRKVKTLFNHLRAEGVSEETLARVRAPIGLDLGGRTPAEIAVSIIAEILMTRYGGEGKPLSMRRIAEQDDEDKS